MNKAQKYIILYELRVSISILETNSAAGNTYKLPIKKWVVYENKTPLP